MAENLIQYQTELSGNVVLLCRFLRQKGFAVSTTEEADVLQALTFIPINKEAHFKRALKAILVKSQFQHLKFDEYYDDFLVQLSKAVNSKTKEAPVKKDKKSEAQQKEAKFESLKSWLNMKPATEEKEIAAHSELEVLTRKNFSDLSKEELRLMMQLLKKMAKKLAHQKSRLKKASKKRRHLDLKRTFRENMRKGGDIQQLLFSKKKERKLKLVLLCDVSKSMDLYSRFFVHLIYAFQNAYDKIETFVFSTALHRVSDILNNHEFDKAFDMISDNVPHWSGGTTIGSCLQRFTNDFGHGMLDKKTIVLILSDGWDTGEPAVMKEAMKTIYKKTKKVVWLNPLAGNESFAPEALGMKTALPYIDILAPAHNLESLKKAMQQLQNRRKLHYTNI